MKKDVFSVLKSTILKIANKDALMYCMGMLTMAKATKSISDNEYQYLYDLAIKYKAVKK